MNEEEIKHKKWLVIKNDWEKTTLCYEQLAKKHGIRKEAIISARVQGVCGDIIFGPGHPIRTSSTGGNVRRHHSVKGWLPTTKEKKIYLQWQKNVPCSACKGIFTPEAMEFDHIKPEEKKHHPTDLYTLDTFEEMDEELNKCMVLCANCHRIKTQIDIMFKNKKRSRTKNQIYIENYKMAHPCVDCKNCFTSCVMEFDHVRGLKSAEISQIIAKRWSFERLKTEIDKCELVCANCHRARTVKRWGNRRKTGLN